jgi:tartrate dehydrogenase/decarboxylase/D-malate dehydrogenase
MKEYRIAVIAGDGIGIEVIPEGIKVLKRIATLLDTFCLKFVSFPWGSDYFQRYGKMMPVDGLKILEEYDAIYFGAVGSMIVPDDITLPGLRLNICQNFDQYANVRPSFLLPGIASPLKIQETTDIDFIVVRENTEGEYSQAGGRAHQGYSSEVATGISIFTRMGVERIIRFAFNLASQRPRKHLISASKSNAQPYTFGLWDEVFKSVGRDFPNVTTERILIDALAARMVLHPETLDVIVASNLFADILTDLGGAICGSLGVAPSSNINPERQYPSMFEPIHGSAPDIYGKGIANPIAMIWSGAMMFEFLGENRAADLILAAIKTVTRRGFPLTPDLGGEATTVEVGDAIMDALNDVVTD